TAANRQYAVIMGKRQHAVKSPSAPTRTPAAEALSVLVVEILRLSGLLTAVGDAMAEPAGQTSARWQVLAAAENGPVTVAQIARWLGLARQSIQRVADLLEREGLTAYEDNPNDRRAQLLRLTPRGRAALATIQKAQRAWAGEVGEAIGEADLRR